MLKHALVFAIFAALTTAKSNARPETEDMYRSGYGVAPAEWCNYLHGRALSAPLVDEIPTLARVKIGHDGLEEDLEYWPWSHDGFTCHDIEMCAAQPLAKTTRAWDIWCKKICPCTPLLSVHSSLRFRH